MTTLTMHISSKEQEGIFTQLAKVLHIPFEIVNDSEIKQENMEAKLQQSKKEMLLGETVKFLLRIYGNRIYQNSITRYFVLEKFRE